MIRTRTAQVVATPRPPAAPLRRRLRVSPNFVQAFTLDGRPYVAKETEPYVQYWLNERYRLLLSMFSSRRGATVTEAIDGYTRAARHLRGVAVRRQLLKAVDDMHRTGVLVGTRDEASRYTSRIVNAYLAHRPFPSGVADVIVEGGRLNESSRVLDLAGGPGDLALALARTSADVSLMDLSRGFLRAARRRAATLQRPLTTIHDSCNRLVFSDESYDVVTVSQALHWLDDVMVCRGVCRVLRPGGSFFVVHSAIDLDDAHPLSYVLGRRSILGHQPETSFPAQVQPLLRRLTLLFDALDAPDVPRHDLAQRWGGPGTAPGPRIVPAAVTLFRQRRPFDLGFARAFLTPRHIESTGLASAEFWRDLEARTVEARAPELTGTQHWAVIQFRRAGTPVDIQLGTQPVIEIGYEPGPVR